jgi:hypothetical protein
MMQVASTVDLDYVNRVCQKCKAIFSDRRNRHRHNRQPCPFEQGYAREVLGVLAVNARYQTMSSAAVPAAAAVARPPPVHDFVVDMRDADKDTPEVHPTTNTPKQTISRSVSRHDKL